MGNILNRDEFTELNTIPCDDCGFEEPVMVTEPEPTEVTPAIEPAPEVQLEDPTISQDLCPGVGIAIPTVPMGDGNPVDITIGAFFGTLIESIKIAWKYHLKSRKHSEHIFLEEYYDEAQDLIDALIEEYQGLFGVVENYENRVDDYEKRPIQYFFDLRTFIITYMNIITEIKENSELKSDVDAILSKIDRTLSKLINLVTEKNTVLKFDDFINMNESLNNLKNEKVYWGLRKRDGRYFMMFGKDKDMYLDDRKSIHIYNPDRFDSWAAYYVQIETQYFVGSMDDGTYVLADNEKNKSVETKEDVDILVKKMEKAFPNWEKTSFKGYIGPEGKHMFVSKTYFDLHLDEESKECFIGISDETQLNSNTDFSEGKSKKLMKKTGYILKPSDSAECVFNVFKEKEKPIETEEELEKFKKEISDNFPKWKQANLFEDMF